MRVKLEDVCERGSSNLKQSDIIDATGDYPIYGASGYIGNVDFYHQDKPYVAVVKDGAGIGRTTLHPAKSSVIGTMQYLLPKENVLPEYLCYVVRYMHLEKYFTGATIPHIYFKDYKNEQFNLDSLERQAEIVDILGKCERVIASREDELQKLDELIKARFVELFGDLKTNTKNWPIASFNDCATIDTNMIHEFDGYEEYPHIGIDSIEKDTGRLVGYRTIAEDGVISGKYLFSPRHIIYSKIRPNLNKVALPDFDGLCSADAYPILVKEDVCTREFFGYTLRSSYFLDYILAFSNRTNLPKVNKNQVEGFTLPLPEIGVQRQFSDFVKQVDKSKVAVQKALDETQLLFDSLMQEYFG
ncbi:MAG: restriction endonuclease subunit S [Anaerovibrio sp.]|nr:restriction endonuclease subunit S [Anaerovibrio sp.]